MQHTAIVIQAGGQSSRMKQHHPVDKALIPFLGKPMILRLIERLRNLDWPIWVVTSQPENYAFLDVPLVVDLMPGTGPLGGMFTALSQIDFPFLAVVACDMPFISVSVLRAQCLILEREGADVVVPRSAGGLEPLHAVYRRNRCLPAVRAALDKGDRRVISWFPTVKVREMTVTETKKFDPELRSWTNVNTWEEFQNAQDLARKLEKE